MDNKYDILKSISQREDGTMPEENADMVHVANVIRRATSSCLVNGIGIADLNEAEKKEPLRIMQRPTAAGFQ